MKPPHPRLLPLLGLLLLVACGGEPRQTAPLPSQQGTAKAKPSQPGPRPAQGPVSTPFRADTALAYIAQQVAFGPRVPNSLGHRACSTWLHQTLARHGADLVVQRATVTDHKGQQLAISNFIARYNPQASHRILLSAHWDTRPVADMDPEASRQQEPILGANDGGSGVGALLELARLMGDSLPPIGVDIMLWDAEDGGDPTRHDDDTYCLGSQYWGLNRHQSGYRAAWGLNLDMVAAQGATFPKEGYSRQQAPNVVDAVWRLADELGHGAFFVDRQAGPIIDDHYYVSKYTGIPVANIIDLRETGNHRFFPHWHTHRDDLDALSPAPLQAVGDVLVTLIYARQGQL